MSYSCGNNKYNQLGYKSSNKICEIQHINGLKNIKNIQCGELHSYCLDTTGTLYTFGCNGVGQLCVSLQESNNNLINKITNCKFQLISSGSRHGIGISLTSNDEYLHMG